MALQLTSFFGLLVLLGLAWVCSSDRERFPWRTVGWGLGLQFALGFVILRTGIGDVLFDVANRGVARLNGFAMEGASMVFGPLGRAAFLEEKWGPGNGFILVISITATIILISALSSLLYHWGWLQRVVHWMAWVMQKSMGTSGSETLAAAANIFMGQTEAPLVIKPYLAGMTRSELLALMTGGMSTIAGGVLAVYVTLGASPGHLVTASIMSAPAALMIAKIMLPEREVSETAHTAPLRVERTAANGIDALVRGASEGMALSLNVAAMLIAFVAVVALANYLLGVMVRPLGWELTLQEVFGWLNAPFAWLMGVAPRDCELIGRVLGERIVLNEFFGYLTLTQQRNMMDDRSFVLATYALCGFANFGSIAIQIGGIGALAPNRRVDLAQLGIRAMVAGLLACYMTACVVGTMLR